VFTEYAPSTPIKISPPELEKQSLSEPSHSNALLKSVVRTEPAQIVRVSPIIEETFLTQSTATNVQNEIQHKDTISVSMEETTTNKGQGWTNVNTCKPPMRSHI